MNENPYPYPSEPTPFQAQTPIQSSVEPPRGTFNRRIGRLGYFLGHIYLLAPMLVLMVLVFFLLPALGLAGNNSGVLGAIVSIFLYLSGIAIIVTVIPVQLSLHVRRVHDLGHPWYWMLFLLVPLLNIVFSLYLYFAPGQPGANKYGEPVASLKFLDVLGFTKPQ